MKQRSTIALENAAAEQAVAAALKIRPDLDGEPIQAVLSLVARDTARLLTEALTNEGYISTAPKSPFPDLHKMIGGIGSKKLKPEEVAGPAIELALGVLSSLLAKQVANGVKKPLRP